MSFKINTFALATIAMFSLPLGAMAQSAGKVGVVDSQKLMAGAAPARAANERFEKLVEGKTKEAENRTKELRELQKRLSAQEGVLSEDKIRDLARQIEEKRTALTRFNEDSKRELGTAEREMLDELSAQLQPVIDSVGRELGYSMILDKLRAGLVYVDGAFDITDAVLKRVNSGTPAAPAKK